MTKETDSPSQSCQHNTPTHGESPTAIPNTERRGVKERRRKAGHEEERREEKTSNKGTQWCSGITCVLAWLRAHYPEHQHKEEEEEEEEERDRTRETSDETTHPSHHRPSTMTQPCHKDTTPTNNAVTTNTVKGGMTQRGTGQYKGE